MLAGIFFCYGFYWNTIAVHVVPYATGMSISAVGAANILAIAGGVGIAGRLTVGSASDRMGSRSSIVLAISLMTIGMIWLLFSRQAWMFYLFAAVFGLGYGSLSALQAAATAELFGLSAVGILLGCFSFSFTIGGAIGPVLSGYLFDAASSYTPAFIICIIFSVTGLTLALLLRPVEKESEHDTARSS
jgi:MFS family permease